MRRVLIETICSVVFYVLLAVAVSSTVNMIIEVEEAFEAVGPDEVLGKTVEVSAFGVSLGTGGFQFEAIQEVTDSETGQPETESINVKKSPLPWALFIFFTIPWLIYSYKTRDRSKSFRVFAMNMTEFQEGDEREIQITRSATKSAYKSVGISVPLLLTGMVFYPILRNVMPGYPVYLLAAAIIIPTLVYGIVWIKEYRK